jgi:hypothetical protein
MAMGTSVFRIRIELIFRLCWKLITPCGDPQRPPANVGRAAFSPISTSRRMASNGRPHHLEPRRSESDCRMLLFTSALDPTMMKQPAQHQFTRRNGQVSDDLPIVHA